MYPNEQPNSYPNARYTTTANSNTNPATSPSTSPTTATASASTSAPASAAMPPPLGAPFAPAPAAGWYPGPADPHARAMHPAQAGFAAPPLPTHPQRPASIITVFEVSPQSGYEGTPINVACDLNFPPFPDQERNGVLHNRVRLLFGNVPVEASVVGPTATTDSYLLSACAPPLHTTGARGSWSIPVKLEAINEFHGLLETSPLGEFHYLGDATGTPKRSRKKLEHESPTRKMNAVRGGVRRRHEDDPYGPPLPGGTAQPFVYDSPPPQTAQAPGPPGLVRTTQMLPASMGASPFVMRTKAKLEIEGDLSTMKNNWSPEMWANRRCLVEFKRRRQDATVLASFRAIEEKDWQQNMIVISCLYHDARQECYFTSVDAIYLLECLMETRYTTEEKNRIRRNLESFKPTTLQKNEGQWQDFYAHIMNYPNPKPRNIDKGLKVFPWNHLEQALKKIFGNYSAYLNTSFNFQANPMDPHVQQVSYGHHHTNSMTYAEDRGMVNQTPSSVSDDLSAYVDMSPTATTSQYRTSGASVAAASEMVSPYSTTNDGEFNSYVNISPVATPASAMPRDSYPPQLGLYVPATAVDPSLTPNGHPHPNAAGHPNAAYQAAPPGAYTTDPHLPYAHVTGSRTPSSSDLRVAYDRAAHPAQYPQQQQ